MAKITAHDIENSNEQVTMEYFKKKWDEAGINCSLEDLNDTQLESIATAYDTEYANQTGSMSPNDGKRKNARIQFLEFLKLRRGGGI
ncbi:MAG: hypothetical protein OXG24_07155 [Gammaproteobacteria bacterium]|nr:hypothetical protein [Gammaproteobacteria bacterium]